MKALFFVKEVVVRPTDIPQLFVKRVDEQFRQALRNKFVCDLCTKRSIDAGFWFGEWYTIRYT